MSHTYTRSSSRVAGLGLLGVALVFGLVSNGDRSVWSAGPGNTGVDPLEILNLSVRPNAIFVLDSSGSMAQTLLGDAIGADHVDAKLAVAKSVINTLVAANQTRVSFQFGRYTQPAVTVNASTQTSENAGGARFEYTTAGNPTFTVEPAVQLRLFEVPTGTNWTVSFTNGASTYTTSAIPPGTYTGTEFAELIASLMNTQNNAGYAGSFSDPAVSASPAFTFTRSTGSTNFGIRFQVMDATLRGLLRAVTIESNDTTSPYSIQPHVGSLTTGGGMAGPTSFVVAASQTVAIAAGATNYSTTLTAGTYASGQALADHVAARMNAMDTGATVASIPNSFVISGNPLIRIRRNGVNYDANLDDGTYTGDQLADEIALQMNGVDPATAAQANYAGSYNEATGIFTFTRSGTITNQNFEIRWASWNAGLRTLMGAPATNASDTTSPYSLATTGVTLSTTIRSYQGLYDGLTGVFTFTRTGSSTENFGIRWSAWTAALRTLMGTPAVDATDTTNPYSLASSGKLVAVAVVTVTQTGPSNSTAPLALYRRNDSGTYEQTSGTKTYYQMFANKFFNGQTLSVLVDGTPCYLTNGTATANPQITIQTKNTCAGAVTDTMVFPAAGANGWAGWGGSTTCGGFESLVSLAPCTQDEQLTAISTHLQRELAAPAGTLPGYVESGSGVLSTQPSVTGIRAAGYTPIAESLIDIRDIFTTTVWPVVTLQSKKQSTFVIFLTDGDDTCSSSTTSSTSTGDNNALRAAHKAERLRARFDAAQPASAVTTFVIALGTGVSANRANWIAWGGSGMNNIDANGVIQTGPTLSGAAATASTRWNAAPTATQRANCTTCRDAFLASDAASLTEAIQAAIDLGQSTGEFSDQQSITETLYEYVTLAPQPTPIASPSPTVQPSPYHPLNPQTRYGSTIPVLLQSTFDLPAYSGHLKAFRNNNGVSELLWDAGAKLKARVVDDVNAMSTTAYTFQGLYGNARTTPVKDSTARIKRRIYTTSRQGVLSGYTAQNLLSANTSALAGPQSTDPTRLEMWPPSAAVAPTAAVVGSSVDVGSLDGPMGLLSATTVAQVQAKVPAACLATADATPLNHPLCNSATASIQLAQARREAREILLAYFAGAQVQYIDGKPERQSSDGSLMYVARPWIMAESTLAAPAVVTPPLIAPTVTYKSAEYLLYRDGPRDAQGYALNATASGLGLRNPDFESAQSDASRDNLDLKPQMSVVYHATNFGLHAFRAGPCPTTGIASGFFSASSLNCYPEAGGEELWAFIPGDQLGKLVSVAKTQSRLNKTYMLAAPVRITDVFVSGTASTNVSGNVVSVTGVWRTLAIFGRGAGGKNLTAIDVTVPGPFTKHSLNTNAPIVVWSRGNFDTTDGLVKSGSNDYANNAADYTAYLGLGETWSVPAVGFVNPTLHVTPRRSVEFALFMGSGFSDSSSEGKTFFVLDALSGDVVRSFALANGTTATTVLQTGLPLPNALVASPAVYAVDDAGNSPAGLNFLTNPVEAKAKFVYFGDLHSRIWRYALSTPTTAPAVMANLSGDGDQPFSNGLSILEVGKVPNLWFSSGRDSRVVLRTNPPRFRMYGYSDATGSSPAGPVTQTFFRDFPANYRGNSSPASAFAGLPAGVTPPTSYTPIVFFTGLTYVANGAAANTVCQSRFDSVLFALQGLTGLAAFDLNSTSTAESDDAFATVVGQVLQNPHITSEGTIVIDRGLGAQVAPPPPASPKQKDLPPQSQTVTVVSQGLTPGTGAWNTLRATTVPYRSGTAVCNVSN